MTRRAICACLFIACVSVAQASAQTPLPTPAPAAPATAAPETPKDPLGRDTPRGTVLGFMNAARDNKQDVAPLYLDSGLSGQDATELAQQLRAQLRPVKVGASTGDEVLVVDGLAPGDRVATSGSFKLRDAVRVAVIPPATTTSAAPAAPARGS